ncbi:MAG: FHA domain-containing protein [Prevotella sp.]|nr:FHA domain-containing protein [Prevotella sp.]
MIICPNCKEEIDDDSHYCDQCGQALLYCERCGRVGIGRRCTNCGGLMLSPDEYQKHAHGNMSLSESVGFTSRSGVMTTRGALGLAMSSQNMPQLMLFNDSLNIRIHGVNGAIIGRRQGPYSQFFDQNMYVSGVHAQLKFNYDSGWSVIDKHSSNGTKLNERMLQPDVEMLLKNGDILTIANVNLQVSIS